MMRVGHGFDSHAYVTDKERPLILGGVTFESDFALQGHSDSDVVTHACIDSFLSPTGLGDIGTLFPNNERTPKEKAISVADGIAHPVNVSLSPKLIYT